MSTNRTEKEQVRVHIRWMIRRDMPEVLHTEQESFEFAWSEEDFLEKTEGSAIRRIGHERWLRNIAIALGNAPSSSAVVAALQAKIQHPSALVREHVQWALAQHVTRAAAVSAPAVGAADVSADGID